MQAWRPNRDWIPRIHTEQGWLTAHLYMQEKQRWEGEPQSKLACQTRKKTVSGSRRGPVSICKEGSNQEIPDVYLRLLHSCTHVCLCTHINTHACTEIINIFKKGNKFRISSQITWSNTTHPFVLSSDLDLSCKHPPPPIRSCYVVHTDLKYALLYPVLLYLFF